ncbi:AAA domain-containing protein, putative AbiEii toxin, Type IV TA system [Streptomyces sp. 1222.2]|uniref:AAA family ATPase n=1 Tax=Streptomyces sp. 1222.2 TaxID=1938833 RepID=UPI000BCEFFE0|nr:AAA family ATPase [Streptomyces sp. 1222.2]SOD70168.1 AAA domain-containing protein, putative AbiEii toxin, Type IV TA system [Streptomyces sp. 1222.2]
MQFKVIDQGEREPTGLQHSALLIRDRWDDFGFATLFYLVVYDEQGMRHDIGEVKIGRSRMQARSPLHIPTHFETLNDSFFSLGQDDSYYTRVAALGTQLREILLLALRDMVFDDAIFRQYKNESVTRKSLMRFVNATAVQDQFRRIAHGGERVRGFEVTYKSPQHDSGNSVLLPFTVAPQSLPPTNIHVLIGRNGVGKSYLLNKLARCIADRTASEAEVGSIIEHGRGELDTFANLVIVTFSAFDEFPQIRDEDVGIDQYAYVGLRLPNRSGQAYVVRNPDQLADDFARSVEACLTGRRAQRWAGALRTLRYAGSGFLEDSWVESFLDIEESDHRRQKATSLFGSLSSGHKSVLLTLTRLVEHVTERTLVVLDEPESHLHPPLLAAFIRALSDLLTDRNGLAIVATHSPVVLQEVPASCVWKLRRYGEELTAERPTIESFGENVGILTHEVFGLEVTDAGYHRYLRRLVRQGFSFDQVMNAFGSQLGGEARALTQALISVRDAGGGLGPAVEDRFE